MAVQKAIVVEGPGKAVVVNNWPIPTTPDDSILVKNVAVGLNPTDWKSLDNYYTVGALVGCDFAGVIESVGKDVKKSWKKGDRIAGVTHGDNALNLETGAFAEYVIAKGDIQTRLPESFSFQDGATLGVGLHTLAQVKASLKLASPADPVKDATPLLIYGGSTASGTLAIQYAKLSGYRVISTCSPHNFDLLYSLGADTVFNYNDSKSATEIRKSTNDNLKLVMDCIGLESSAKFCDEALSTSGGQYCSLVPVKIERENIDSSVVLAYTSLGEAVKIGPRDIPPQPEHRANAEEFAALFEKLLEEGKIKVHPPRVGKDGLKGVLEGLDLMRENKVSGQKLVYNVDETP